MKIEELYFNDDEVLFLEAERNATPARIDDYLLSIAEIEVKEYE